MRRLLSSRLSGGTSERTSAPLIRSTGGAATARCRSEARRSRASRSRVMTFSRSPVAGAVASCASDRCTASTVLAVSLTASAIWVTHSCFPTNDEEHQLVRCSPVYHSLHAPTQVPRHAFSVTLPLSHFATDH